MSPAGSSADDLLRALAARIAAATHPRYADDATRVRRGAAATAPGSRAAPACLAVAFSGGIDSSVLLHALVRLARTGATGVPLPRAMHVHHGLLPEADAFAAHCADACARLGVAFDCVRVDAAPLRGESPEAAAREARYAALAAGLGDGEVLLTAHHADDQAETLLLRLMRGSGPRGAAGIAAERAFGAGRLLRPLLDRSRAEIEALAGEWRIEWVDDPSNRDPRHPRNRLRHEVLPLLEAIRAGSVRSLARSASLHSRAARVLEELAMRDLAACRDVDGATLLRSRLTGLATERRREGLRVWLRERGLAIPGEARLAELDRQLCEAAPGRAPCIAWPGGEVRVYRDRVFAYRGPPPPLPASARWSWDPRVPLELPFGRLSAAPVAGAGLRATGPLEVRLRAGGERFRPAGSRHRRSLKRMLQECGMPPWRRARLPLIFAGDALAGVGDLWIGDGHEAGAGEAGWRLRWEPHEP